MRKRNNEYSAYRPGEGQASLIIPGAPISDDFDYTQFYQQAKSVDIVGIALDSFISSLYPQESVDHFERATRSPAFRLRPLRESPLWTNLKEGLALNAYLLNPFSPFVRTRAKEENNPECRSAIFRNIGTLRCLYGDLKQVQRDAEWRVKGTLTVRLFDRNPYLSVFLVDQRVLLTGFLLRGHQGKDCPKIPIDLDGNGATVVDMVKQHLSLLRLQGYRLFDLGPKIDPYFDEQNIPTPSYDTFLSYNSKDLKAVEEISEYLKAQGVLPWLDLKQIGGGSNWQHALEDIIQKVKCAVTFVGPRGLGPWEEMEVRLILEQCVRKNLRVIPVVLPGVRGEPRWPQFLKQVQCVDLRNRKEEALKQLVNAIERAIEDREA